MPEMDGVETARAIRACVGADVPIIILSAYDWTDIEEETSAAGVNKHIANPLDLSVLARVLKVLMNHRSLVADLNVSRSILPQDYQFQNWNNGLLKGTVQITRKDSSSTVLLYGMGGIWQTDDEEKTFTERNAGLPVGADYRNIRNLVQMPDGSVFAAGLFGLYRLGTEEWQQVPFCSETLRLSDLAARGDTLVVVGRSHLYTAVPPNQDFQQVELKAAPDYTGKVTLFRTMWLIHSGEIWGTAGKILMDVVALVLIFLIVTGWLFWALHRPINLRRWNFKWHNLVGRKTIILTIFIAFTGWCLRPPLLIPLAITKTAPIPGSELDSPNAWHDKLRCLRFDAQQNSWLLSTSEGFYSLQSLSSRPIALEGAVPPVSVMGLNVLEQQPDGTWVAGSFSGMYAWDRNTGSVTDFFTGESAQGQRGAPVGQRSISGYTRHFGQPAAVEYGAGTTVVAQPDEMRTLPMSLWALSLEVHVGRIYTWLGGLTGFYVFLAGLLALWVLWSGWKIRKR